MAVTYKQMADCIRVLSADAVQKANSGHPGMPMGMADVATVLFKDFLKHNPADPAWADRDRFILSAGHGSMLLYSLLYLTGYADITLDEIKNFRQLHAKTAGHPEYGHVAGIETTTGPLGQGITNAVGFALAEAHLNAKFGKAQVDHYTYTIAGDGCLMEGISQEAISFAGHLGLDKLIVLFDDNSISIDGSTDIATSEDQTARFKACGWHVQNIDGHDYEAIAKAIKVAKAHKGQPSMIACKTTIGFGAPNKAGTAGSHGSPLGDEEIQGLRNALGWQHPPFDIPTDILDAWRDSGANSQAEYDAYQARQSADFKAYYNNEFKHDLTELKNKFIADKPNMATRKSSQKVLEELTAQIPQLVGGSADLTGSNGTITSHTKPVDKNNYGNRYVHYGVREHAMAAIMNGMALHGGIIPYSGTFLVFSDYCRPSIRLSALMGTRVIYVMTHDSIGLGEDGPTHQPVEHLSALRAIPNLYNFRPADEVEVAECWELALSLDKAPSVMALTRQGLKSFRDGANENLSGKGAYIVSGDDNAEVTILASGSEVEIAIEAATKLGNAKVVSVPCMDLFDEQSADYKKQILGTGLRVAIEAGLQQSWDKYLREDDIFIGMSSFGASAPMKDLYEHFGITVDNVVNQVQAKLDIKQGL